MSTAFDLMRESAAFADQLTSLLNATVCNGPRLSAAGDGCDRAVVRYRGRTRGIPLTIDRRRPRAHLEIRYRLGPDPEREHLAVISSYVSICADEDLRHRLLHYDYEREKADGYPEAHVQVVADPAAWAALGPAGRPFAKSHLPVGGRRFRPTVEDVVEYAVMEGLADARPGWRAAVDGGRAKFHAKQLRAAVRRDPDTAWRELAPG
ncbi:MAG TPA: hypothetical protein VNA20_03865 [Frankiaceae bacterium]|nr:hypothetical protein [Frankiaceae bacterium]